MRIWTVFLLTTELSPRSLTPKFNSTGIRSLVEYQVFRPSTHPVALPPERISLRPCLNMFRGEPAISKLDWHITPTHRSSKPFVTDTGAGLPPIFIGVHPIHGQIAWFRVCQIPLYPPATAKLLAGERAIHPRFHYAYPHLSLLNHNFQSVG